MLSNMRGQMTNCINNKIGFTTIPFLISDSVVRMCCYNKIQLLYDFVFYLHCINVQIKYNPIFPWDNPLGHFMQDLKTTIMGGELRIKLLIRLFQPSLAGVGWLGLSLAISVSVLVYWQNYRYEYPLYVSVSMISEDLYQ